MTILSRLFVALGALTVSVGAQSPGPYVAQIGNGEGAVLLLRPPVSSSVVAATSFECPFGGWSCAGLSPGAPLYYYSSARAMSSPALLELESYGYKSSVVGWPAHFGVAIAEWHFDDVVFGYGGGDVPISVAVNLEILFAQFWGSLPPSFPDEFTVQYCWTQLTPSQLSPVCLTQVVTNTLGVFGGPSFSLRTNRTYRLSLSVRKDSGAGGGADRGSHSRIAFAATPFTITPAEPTPGLRADSLTARIVDNAWSVAGPAISPELATSAPIQVNQTEDIYVSGAAPGTPGLLFVGLGALHPGLVVGPWFSLDLVAPLVLLGFVADAQGQSTISIPVPLGTEGSMLALQAAWFLSPDPADWYGSAALPVQVQL